MIKCIYEPLTLHGWVPLAYQYQPIPTQYLCTDSVQPYAVDGFAIKTPIMWQNHSHRPKDMPTSRPHQLVQGIPCSISWESIPYLTTSSKLLMSFHHRSLSSYASRPLAQCLECKCISLLLAASCSCFGGCASRPVQPSISALGGLLPRYVTYEYATTTTTLDSPLHCQFLNSISMICSLLPDCLISSLANAFVLP